jgi:L-rhamnose mutarotase
MQGDRRQNEKEAKMTNTSGNIKREGWIMENTMAINMEIVGTDNTKDMVRSHVAIWQEILRDVRTQTAEAEYGKLYKVVGNEDTKELVSSMTQDKKRGHVAIWQEILKDVRSQWTEAEYGK